VPALNLGISMMDSEIPTLPNDDIRFRTSDLRFAGVRKLHAM